MKSWLQRQHFKSSLMFRIVLFAGLGLSFFLLLLGNLPEPLEIRKFEPSPGDIRSPITIEDIEKTEEAREAAVNKVEPVYRKKDSITEEQLDKLTRLFTETKKIRGNEDLSREDKIRDLKSFYPASSISDQTFEALLDLPQQNLEIAEALTTNVVLDIMMDGVQGYGGVQQAKTQIRENLSVADYGETTRLLIQELAEASIIPNIVYDDEATRQLQEEARQSVKPVMIYKNDIIVEKDQRVDSEIYRKLQVVGLLSEGTNFLPPLALALLSVLIVLFLYIAIGQLHPAILKDNRNLFMLVLILLLTLAAMKIVSLGQNPDHPTVAYLAPAALGTMLITLLIDSRLVIPGAVVLALAAGIMYNVDQYLVPIGYRYTLITLAGTLTGAFTLGKTIQRRYIIRAGILVSVLNVLVITIIYMFGQVSFPWREVSESYVYGVLGGLLSAVLTIGFMPFFEGAFGILSTVKLIELSNPNHPLLRRLLTEAPGTYHHSVIVGNLAESACESIGANGLLARVGSYYHDMGKLNRPSFFIENQMNSENPHDRISPQLSKSIIISHPYDGVKMLKKYRIPEPICDIAEQHHGTSLLKYFYHKAKKESDKPVSEDEFRYPGPRPQFKEAAIIQICDSVEAATRSMSDLTPEKIESLVRGIVKDKLDDGQFDECDLTLKELEIVISSICETLKGMFHHRIEYPNEDELKEVK